jgi:hypothetical protein
MDVRQSGEFQHSIRSKTHCSDRCDEWRSEERRVRVK